MVADRELNASVDGKWAKQSEDVSGNPLVMVNVLAHDLRLCLEVWPETSIPPGRRFLNVDYRWHSECCNVLHAPPCHISLEYVCLA